jgi:hypothetical protein
MVSGMDLATGKSVVDYKPSPRSNSRSKVQNRISGIKNKINALFAEPPQITMGCSDSIIDDPDPSQSSETNPYLTPNYRPCDDTGEPESTRLIGFLDINETDFEGLPSEIKYYTPYDAYLPDYNHRPASVTYTYGGSHISNIKLFPMVVRTNRKYADPFTICENGDDQIRNCIFSGATYKFSRDSVQDNVTYYDQVLWKCAKSNKWQKPVSDHDRSQGVCY